MTLQDHFRPPLSLRRRWHAFHNAWATYMASDLNRRLPEGYFAEPNVQFGLEVDVAAFEEPPAISETAQSYEVASLPIAIYGLQAIRRYEIRILSAQYIEGCGFHRR